ncbi:hypothetical protein CVO74_02870 [Xanthomonas prunicola]|uniref:Glycine zipper 2TM domain-containing protein n=1 Tax=Xanthomonas prunicola TaxID=2053930 RepID=A0A2N3RQG3_9XANT|nr:hypothetical protein XpruCFBP8353_03580 [Xanthomonas prunicola]PKV19012.1 hypothetical protein XpruCFBP8354_03580 [Xanthomonas prunicola]PKV23223.1 hypothetical protein CVO74_02870 [Xanthomonas prunicola]
MSAPALAAGPRHGAIVALEPIENKGDDVPERTRKMTDVGGTLGGIAGSVFGIKSSKADSAGIGTTALVAGAGEAAGRSAGAKIAGNGPAAHYMVKIRFDNKSQVVVSKPSAEVAGLAVGSRVKVTGSGEDMRIQAE